MWSKIANILHIIPIYTTYNIILWPKSDFNFPRKGTVWIPRQNSPEFSQIPVRQIWCRLVYPQPPQPVPQHTNLCATISSHCEYDGIPRLLPSQLFEYPPLGLTDDRLTVIFTMAWRHITPHHNMVVKPSSSTTRYYCRPHQSIIASSTVKNSAVGESTVRLGVTASR